MRMGTAYVVLLIKLQANVAEAAYVGSAYVEFSSGWLMMPHMWVLQSYGGNELPSVITVWLLKVGWDYCWNGAGSL
ncbi:hypothetical protein Nepgr_029677 [Nepenthes gracilis]|uniref:Secreted protein n=1 Tax=Nepenthes gracilis TaxID=150966 RepID=A0AAD3TER4_NEPGR|nr:hypothetical protein Nepgr_029677 [Nepenthes gracilis]